MSSVRNTTAGYNPSDTTAVPPGTCLVHGYHGGQVCPQCSSAASVDPFRLGAGNPPLVAPARDGWVCPKCGSVYAPYMPECSRCCQPLKVTCEAPR